MSLEKEPAMSPTVSCFKPWQPASWPARTTAFTASGSSRAVSLAKKKAAGIENCSGMF